MKIMEEREGKQDEVTFDVDLFRINILQAV